MGKLATLPKSVVSVDALIVEREKLTREHAQLGRKLRAVQAEIIKLTRPASVLTVRQEEVLNLIRLHLSNKEIASQLNVTVRAVKFHVASLLKKMDCQDRHEL